MSATVSVIVPIFKVERFIERNARVLFEQNLEDIEYIFVDDCSPDKSIALLEKVLEAYPAKKANTKIIRHPVNKGLPSARNSGLEVATGNFIFHCDSDDWIEKDALSKLYHQAEADQSDIVWCDWYLSFKDNERYMIQPSGKSGTLTGKESLELLLGGRIRYNVWNKLVKRQLYINNNIRFPDGYGMGEDMTMIKLFALATKVSYLPEALYHYVQLNEEAFTKKTTPQHLEQIRYNVDGVVHFLENRYGTALSKEIQFFKLNTKLPFLITDDPQSYQRWLDWYPEANSYIDQNPLFNSRTKFIQKAALKKQFWVLKLYYRLVIRFIYGIIYK
ncbi:glycosyltransferase [Sphingobacterium sp. SRCM116780]|uniref:glycosyltransferase family 2 protein n=1 Tax=Sphingobacterium sp. SRCM116780 TaxID=2907623 RepID=UPI001F2A4455|nr:glycosyltransferase family 2 protein [Sphingobacterium sp. SRCM116780]UIR56002.1 glycosyltransferase [Sphingobacterium sp. SRCM116780]